jgi:hypothetical protein
VLTPVLGVTCDNMTKTITSSSTFRVEKQSWYNLKIRDSNMI